MSATADLLADAEVVLTCGAGGVGKTTVAASFARRAAEQGRSVALVTVDPARRLADAMGIELADELREVAIDGPGRLQASMIDTSAAWDRLIVERSPDPDTATRLLSNPIYRNITARFIQSHEYIAIERLHELSENDDIDLLVVDTPPSGHAADLLDAPARMVDFFEGNLMKWLTAPTRSRVAAVASRPFFRAVDLLLGREFVADLSEFFSVLQQLGPGFTARADAVAATLRLPSTRFVVVASPNPRPVREAVAFAGQLADRQLTVGAVVANRVLPRWLDDDDLVEVAARLADGEGIDGLETREVADAADRAVELHRVAIADRRRIDRLGELGPVTELPLLPGVDGDTMLSTLGEQLAAR